MNIQDSWLDHEEIYSKIYDPSCIRPSHGRGVFIIGLFHLSMRCVSR